MIRKLPLPTYSSRIHVPPSRWTKSSWHVRPNYSCTYSMTTAQNVTSGVIASL